MPDIADKDRIRESFGLINGCSVLPGAAVDPALTNKALAEVNKIGYKNLLEAETAKHWYMFACRKPTEDHYVLQQAKTVFCQIEEALPASTPEQRLLLNRLKFKIYTAVRPLFRLSTSDPTLISDIKALSGALREESTKLDELLNLNTKLLPILGEKKGSYNPINLADGKKGAKKIDGFEEVDSLDYEQILEAEKELKNLKREKDIFFTPEKADVYEEEKKKIDEDFKRAETSLKDRKKRLEEYGKLLPAKIAEFIALAKQSPNSDARLEAKRVGDLEALYTEFQRTFSLVDQQIFTDRGLKREKLLVDLSKMKNEGLLKRNGAEKSDIALDDMLQPKLAFKDLGWGALYAAGIMTSVAAAGYGLEMLGASAVLGTMFPLGIGFGLITTAVIAGTSLYANVQRGGVAAPWFK